MAAAQTPENNGDDRDLIFMMRHTYIGFNVDPLTKFSSSSSRSIELKDIFSWNISHEGHRSPHETSNKLYDGMGHPFLSLKESQWELRQNIRI